MKGSAPAVLLAASVGIAAAAAIVLLRKRLLRTPAGKAAIGAIAAVPATLAATLAWMRRARLPAEPKSDEQMAAEWRWASLP